MLTVGGIYFALKNIIKKVLFKRGSFSVEVIVSLIAWKVCLPNHMHLTRGNHETKNMNKLYGFEGEIIKKYSSEIYDIFAELFWHLPLVYVLKKKVFVTHGGLFEQDNVKLDDIRKLNRYMEPPEKGLMCGMIYF